jgi:hypothetical protein
MQLKNNKNNNKNKNLGGKSTTLRATKPKAIKKKKEMRLLMYLEVKLVKVENGVHNPRGGPGADDGVGICGLEP